MKNDPKTNENQANRDVLDKQGQKSKGSVERFREWAQQHRSVGEGSLEWYEKFYQSAGEDTQQIPWADGIPNPNLIEWLEREPPLTGSALVVGCGLGEDAEALSARGLEVTAFDISKRAIDWAKERWPNTSVRYVTADLFESIPGPEEGFDFVFEAYTLQALPPKLVSRALKKISQAVKVGGTLLLVTRARHEKELNIDDGPPWPLHRDQIFALKELGFREVRFEDYWDREDPPRHRFRAHYIRD